MSYSGPTSTKFGRYQIALPFRADLLHLHDGSELREVDHEPPVPVLDQEDLLAQGIDTSQLVPGAQKVDALGSCTCNAGTVSLAERFAAKNGTIDLPGIGISSSDAVANEKYAIVLYHDTTYQTGDPSSEWPVQDCGSNGWYVATELKKRGLVTGQKVAHNMTSLVSLLQSGTAILGSPFFYSWMEPDGLGFVDGQGAMEDLQTAIASGVAGGHETCLAAVERLVFDALGHIELGKSHVRVRNSWSASWGDSGSFRIHLSTLHWLGSYCDYRQFVL